MHTYSFSMHTLVVVCIHVYVISYQLVLARVCIICILARSMHSNNTIITTLESSIMHNTTRSNIYTCILRARSSNMQNAYSMIDKVLQLVCNLATSSQYSRVVRFDASCRIRYTHDIFFFPLMDSLTWFSGSVTRTSAPPASFQLARGGRQGN